MFRKVMSVALLGVVCSAVAYADDEKKPGDNPPGKGGFKLDKAKMFEKMDTNGDGKVTKEEYTKSVEAMMARFKEKAPEKFKGKEGESAERIGKRFDAIDTNKDGTISKEEFEKAEFGSPGGFRGRGKGGPPKDGDKKPGEPEKKVD
jgi:hypothetical protein